MSLMHTWWSDGDGEAYIPLDPEARARALDRLRELAAEDDGEEQA